MKNGFWKICLVAAWFPALCGYAEPLPKLVADWKRVEASLPLTDELRFYINDVEVGKGEEGFYRFRERLEKPSGPIRTMVVMGPVDSWSFIETVALATASTYGVEVQEIKSRGCSFAGGFYFRGVD